MGRQGWREGVGWAFSMDFFLQCFDFEPSKHKQYLFKGHIFKRKLSEKYISCYTNKLMCQNSVSSPYVCCHNSTKILDSKNILIQRICCRAIFSEWTFLNIAQVKLSTGKSEFDNGMLLTIAIVTSKPIHFENFIFCVYCISFNWLTPGLKNKTERISHILPVSCS